MGTALEIAGLALTLVGAAVLAYLDLTAKPPTWADVTNDWKRRRRFAWFGFPAIAAGTIFGIAGLSIH